MAGDIKIEIPDITENAKVDLERWAKYTIEKWEFQVAKFKLLNTKRLINSFLFSVHQESGGNSAMIYFAFERYLRMIDMGVGKGTNIDEQQSKYSKARTVSKNGRKRYPVYNKVLYSEMNKLSKLLQVYFKNSAQKIIVYGTD